MPFRIITDKVATSFTALEHLRIPIYNTLPTVTGGGRLAGLRTISGVEFFYNNGIVWIQVIAGGNGSDVITGSVITVNATPATLVNIVTTVKSVVSIDAIVTGANTTDDTADSYFLKGMFKNIGGNVVQIAPDDSLNFIENPATNAQLVTSGANIIVQVKGLPLKTISWFGRVVRVEVKYI